MITIQEVYEIFRRVQGRSLGRPYKLPKDFNAWYIKSGKATQDNLDMVTKFFNTKWANVNPEEYFEAGFNLFKNFTYHQFQNPKVMNFYIDKDKLKKRTIIGCKADLMKGLKHIKDTYNVTIEVYCRMKDKNLSQPVSDFLANKIGKYSLAYMIYKRHLVLEDHERALVSLITTNYRDLVAEIEESLGKWMK